MNYDDDDPFKEWIAHNTRIRRNLCAVILVLMFFVFLLLFTGCTSSKPAVLPVPDQPALENCAKYHCKTIQCYKHMVICHEQNSFKVYMKFLEAVGIINANNEAASGG